MLEKLVLDKEITKEEYKARLPALEMELFDLERRAKAAKVPTIVSFDGWEAAGKGTSIQVFTENLDPRALRIHPIQDPEPYEMLRPWMWRFWMALPNDGEIGIFDTSWYRHVLEERMDGKSKKREWEEAFHEINELEHQLADDGHVIVKFWLHISKKEQKKRFEKAEKDPKEFFRVTKEMWRQNDDYDRWLAAVEEMLERTETEWAPWTIVESHDKRAARLKIFDTVIAALKSRIAQIPDAPPPLFGTDAMKKAKPEEAARALGGSGAARPGAPAAPPAPSAAGAGTKEPAATKEGR